MADSNGSPVTRAELAAHVKGIDQRFQDVAADVAEIKWGQHAIRDELKRMADAFASALKSQEDVVADQSWFGTRGRRLVDALVVAVIAALVAAGITVGFAYL